MAQTIPKGNHLDPKSPDDTAQPPYRQIRAQYDEDTITVYQAYNAEIASQAVAHQRLNASPLFRPVRMTWIKPSWCWMMYRSGYACKDANQERILAIKMRHADFVGLLERAVLTTETTAATAAVGVGVGVGANSAACNEKREGVDAAVKVQWDPERSVRLGRLDHRSIQIGIRGSLAAEWIERWIVGIEDVTARAISLKAALDANPDISEQELVARGLVPDERAFHVSDNLRNVLGMHVS
ncbi:hypothetical protein PFICI_00410 [Pestalotiopsis fici W106-1]|uniref:ATP-dependent RNA helicase DHX8 n=1 Tax=Pestalotiopsis fici (strain W106-1 / CGMCC3.15140) TaxID=1229662 RepID=W3XM68_PESFW|nr:uncharacterized protein PFICI_00410 [Pestalotiopsis fici W106-1]ETS86582.1 hypothetical protein PFICI_00410 [Pestalotiopsis fici W106-1]